MAFEFISDTVAEKKSRDLYRNKRCITQLFNNEIEVDGRVYLNFSSNDYLGLSADRALHKAFQEGIDKFGSSSVSSSLITGFHESHRALEDTICEWLNQEQVLLFSSGFAANSGVLKALDRNGSGFILDKLSHASIIDGVDRSKGKFTRFLHNDLNSLNKKLQLNSARDNILITESVFSMDGDLAPLRRIQDISNKSDSLLYVDDAHGIGVLGKEGQGAAALLSMNEGNNVVMGTFGKAIATSGAFVAGSTQLVDYLINECKHYIYSTAMCPATAWATKCAITIIKNDQWRRDKLKELTSTFKDCLDKSIRVTPSETSIIGVILHDEKLTIEVAKALQSRGFWVVAIRPPTVPKGLSRLRVTINASHNVKDIIRLANAINEEVQFCQK